MAPVRAAAPAERSSDSVSGAPGGGSSDALLNAETACASAAGQTALQPVDLFVILDRTASD
jgi:hypothetical protein